ncbi:hypothetical protein CH298_12175 [Rhodococcoides fascians]|uniref:ketoacyl-ACP synthase III family protein n=1 Tax=Nocardiaceae TaxID=85025 RepID=UPI0009B91E84|nr:MULTISPECIES: ketoacyl-ACP synthase III family protein [Rhodococcus]OZE89771.1 hypothetical protein CH303_12055 [Rhodococcus fascians]OZD84368.1 hypothetical protein CH258_15650 [Rhodococcus sp. 05-2256-B4]OZD89042.1 hypothetical protein CH257_20140 [Rhodococcus sp. 05-2256-B3]OZD93385.1 hypothetical protein CH260_17785 [Rhodococcus sp. 05-2256-B2]OZE03526.1 hypothetical protein CH285_11560 [Rhodococcus sp. 05-2256-B1]
MVLTEVQPKASTSQQNPRILGASCVIPDGRMVIEPSRTASVATVSGPELAAQAAAAVIESAGVDPEDISLVLHAWSHYQGHDFWSPAHYVAHCVGALSAMPIGINQMCNGAAAAIGLAHDRFGRQHRSGGGGLCLITTGDSFKSPGFDRQASDYGSVYGDGGTALLLGPGAVRTTGGLYVRAVASDAAPELEVMNRGADPFAPAARWYRGTVDVRDAKKRHLRTAEPGTYADRECRAIDTVVQRVLQEIGIDGNNSRIRAVFTPRLNSDILESTYRPLLQQWFRAPVVDYGAQTGHLGAGDIICNLADAIGDGTIDDADGLYLFLSAGAGFTWSAIVIEKIPD